MKPDYHVNHALPTSSKLSTAVIYRFYDDHESPVYKELASEGFLKMHNKLTKPKNIDKKLTRGGVLLI
jgi:hypothetical protein